MRFLVTAGPTREPIDTVRFISNRSTGKMGYALASVAHEHGHDVVLISGPTQLPAPNVTVARITTAAEMLAAVEAHIDWCDVLIMAAAVADIRPRIVHAKKLKKNMSITEIAVEPTTDVLMSLRGRKGRRIFVGFAAETNDLEKEARRKLQDKGLDLIVANDITLNNSGFESDTNQVVLIDRYGVRNELPLLQKKDVAITIVEWIEEHHA